MQDKRCKFPPKRVLEILEATTGGTRRHLYYLLKYLDPKRFSISLIYSNLRDPEFGKDLEEFRQIGITLHEVPMRREISPWSDLIALIKIMSVIHHGHFDLVHAHSSKAGFLGRVAARFLGIKAIVYSPHSFAFQYSTSSCRGGFYRWIERLTGYLHHCLLCVSEGERRIAIKKSITPSEKIEVIPNAIAVGDLVPRRSSFEIRKQLCIGNDATVIGMVAHFRPQKGHRHFIDAMPQILQQCPQARFLIIGDGPLFKETQNHVRRLGVESAMIMTGNQEHPPDFYQIMDIFVLSSLWEGMPYAILEAMAMGLPVVATDIAGNNELVLDGQNGFLIPEMNSDAIASHVIRLIENPELQKRFGMESRRIFNKMPNIEEWTLRYTDLYGNITNV